ncbi:methyltransferase domain-containing protein [Nocardiopsis sp. JB363]|uniref:methyltransferase domain-containing protein n=1 Tax=Nocardiopsis sp. JB363 TaxID=1434837 RepID=UPI00097A3878|nr:methyltransferase domain-containing protein [Nocardiopsis sp. JB363]SIO89868.1 methyltransferase [Nocardiopsis sp. JB363]
MDTPELLARLDKAERRPDALALRARVRGLLGYRPGDTVLDVGCGGGTAVAEMRAEGARAVGFDIDPVMLQTARDRHPESEFAMADANSLLLPDGAARGYRAERVFHAIREPERALAEAHRVLAPGGRLVLVGQDWDAFMIAADDTELTRTLVHANARAMPDPSAPRRQPELLRAAGFTGIEAEGAMAVFTDDTAVPMLTGLASRARDAGALSPRQAEKWVAEQRARAVSGRLFLAIPYLLVSADRT